MRGLVERARVAHLATVAADGQPHIVPVCFVLSGETAYSAVDRKPKRGPRLRRMVNIEATGHGRGGSSRPRSSPTDDGTDDPSDLDKPLAFAY